MPTEPTTPTVDRRALAFGLGVLVVGVLLTLSHLHVLPPLQIGQLWPLILVGLGIGRLVAPKHGRRRWPGAVLTLVGLWLLMNSLHWWNLPIDVAWSAALAIGGLCIVADALIDAFAIRRRAQG